MNWIPDIAAMRPIDFNYLISIMIILLIK